MNCLELMPVTSTKLDFDWGYGPVQYFAPNSEYGGPLGLMQLVDACHANGFAVILDLVYQHVDPSFPYAQVYQDIANAKIPGMASPMIGANGPFGPVVDFSQVFAQQFFQIANQRWLDVYHVDGFRYDEVTDLYQSPTDTGYALLAYETYLYSRDIPASAALREVIAASCSAPRLSPSLPRFCARLIRRGVARRNAQ